MFRSFVHAVMASLGLLGTPASSHAGDFSQYEELQAMVAQLEADKVYAPGELTALFDRVARQPAILAQIAKPAESSKEWKDYRPIFMTDARINDGLAFWDKYQDVLTRAEQTYGVPAPMILAILGVETKYGVNKGNYRVVEALATLGFDYPPRAPFFRKELREFLVLSKQNGQDPFETRGSYAGAMGYPQFMPSSWRNLAVDFDGDGRIDLRNSPVDAIGSVAHFLVEHGWKRGEPTVFPATVSNTESGRAWDMFIGQGLEAKFTLDELKAAGVSPNFEPPADMRFGLVDLQNGGEPTEYWLGATNFFAITQYNRSFFYAMSVIDLGRAVRSARGG